MNRGIMICHQDGLSSMPAWVHSVAWSSLYHYCSKLQNKESSYMREDEPCPFCKEECPPMVRLAARLNVVAV